MSVLEKKFNHAYEVLTTTVNKTKDEDVCFGEYVGESLKKFQDRKTKSWIRHNILNILYQAECGGAGGHPQQYPGPGYNQPNQPSCNSSSSSYPWPQANNQQQMSPLELQINQEDEYSFYNF